MRDVKYVPDMTYDPLLSDDERLAVRLMCRISQAIHKQNPAAYAQFHRYQKARPGSAIATIRVGGFELSEHEDRWFTIIEPRPVRPYQVFDGKLVLGRPNFSWNYELVVNQVMPALDQFLILEDLASL